MFLSHILVVHFCLFLGKESNCFTASGLVMSFCNAIFYKVLAIFWKVLWCQLLTGLPSSDTLQSIKTVRFVNNLVTILARYFSFLLRVGFMFNAVYWWILTSDTFYQICVCSDLFLSSSLPTMTQHFCKVLLNLTRGTSPFMADIMTGQIYQNGYSTKRRCLFFYL